VLIENLVPMAAGLVFMLFIHKLLIPVFPDTGLLGSIKAKLTVHPYIPPVCTMLLFWHLSYVVLRLFLHIRPEFAVVRADPIPPGVDELTEQDITTIARRAMVLEQQRGMRLLTRRIFLAIQHLGISRDTAELGDLLRRRADADRQRSSTAYLWPQFLVWAIPILGFVGTVLGIGTAVSGLEATIESAEGFKGAIKAVTGNLGVAFDTTLVALVMSIIALLVQTLISQQEYRLLADVEDYLTYRLQSRIRSETVDVRIDNVLQSSLTSLQALQERMHAEHTERTQVTMQSIMRGQQTTQQTLAQLPALIGDASQKTAQMLSDTREALHSIGQHASLGMQEAFREAIQMAKGDLAAARRQLFEGAASEAGRILDQNTERYLQAVAPLQHDLERVAGNLENIFRDSERLLMLQNTLNDNIASVNRTQKLDETLARLHESVAHLRPALEKLSKPVPVRLTLAGLDVDDGGGDAHSTNIMAPRQRPDT
jgi:biopolymer transport protein ExbB/TolQ/vacuolar-type H+-ATPase subunit E/Vma4